MISKRALVQILSCVLYNFNIINLKIAWFPRTGLIFPALNCYSCPFATGACPFGLLQKSSIEMSEGITSFGVIKSLTLLPFYLIGTIMVYGLVLGRAVCGWLCPFGFLQDLFAKFTGKDRIPKELDKKLKVLKYFVLAASIVLAVIFLDTIFCKLCPAATVFAAVPFRILFGRGATTAWYIARIGIFSGIFFGVLFLARRFWCRYLCPVGTIFSFFNKISLVQLNIKSNLCIACKTCSEVCPMGIEVYGEHVALKKKNVDSVECIKCGDCGNKCPTKALGLGLKS